MKKLILLIVVITYIFFCSCKKEEVFDLSNWDLKFSDEFNDTVINKAKWKTDGLDWKQQLSTIEQHYVVSKALKLKNGILKIEANRDTVMGVVYDDDFNPHLKKFYFTSGLLHSSFKFSQKYGYFETRAKVPKGIGFWPAFWLYGYNKMPSEIDVFEIFGSKPSQLRMTNHYRNKDGEKRMSGFTYQGPDFSKEFHVFGVEWNPKEIIWYLDGKKVFSSEAGVSNEQLFIILSMGVGEGSLLANDKTIFPSALEIDYVRVYKKKQN